MTHWINGFDKYIDLVVGIQWGDEGKGKLVDELLHKYSEKLVQWINDSDSYNERKKIHESFYENKDSYRFFNMLMNKICPSQYIFDFMNMFKLLCIRGNGGANAGHSIYSPTGLLLDTHLCPSGILTNKCMNIIGNGVIMNFYSFFKELDNFKIKGYDLYNSKNILISNKAPVTSLLHCLYDKLVCAKIGTTGKGIGTTMADIALRIGLRMNDFMTDGWRAKIDNLYEHYQKILMFNKNTPIVFDKYPESEAISFKNLNELKQYEINFF